jgi:hypothetical protein
MANMEGHLLDFRVPAEQNETSGCFNGEASVGKIEDVEKRLGRRINGSLGVAGAVILILLGWLGTGTAYLISMNGDIHAIKQYEKDRGGEIVKGIENPKSPEQLTANLALASAQIRVARSEHRKADGIKLAAIQEAILHASREHADLPETWQAAVQLVDYKYQLPADAGVPQANCLDSMVNDDYATVRNHDGTNTDVPMSAIPKLPYRDVTVALRLANCSLDLEDHNSFLSTAVGKFYSEEIAKYGITAGVLLLDLKNVHVTYSGGKLLPIKGFRFIDCSFELKPPIDLPNKGSQFVTSALLEANASVGEIRLPVGM